jgi:hypothetical protein
MENLNEHEILTEAAKPLVEYLQKYHTPHTIVIVDVNSAEVLSGEIITTVNIEPPMRPNRKDN